MKRGVFALWIFRTLSVVSVLNSACQNGEIEISASTQSPPAAKLQIDGKDISGNETQIPVLNPNAPIISAITFPEYVGSDAEFELGEVEFSDADGDVISAQFTLVGGGCMEFEYFALNSMDYLRSGDRFSGAFQFKQACRKCSGSNGDLIQMRVQLYDRAGNESEAGEYQFICE